MAVENAGDTPPELTVISVLVAIVCALVGKVSKPLQRVEAALDEHHGSAIREVIDRDPRSWRSSRHCWMEQKAPSSSGAWGPCDRTRLTPQTIEARAGQRHKGQERTVTHDDAELAQLRLIDDFLEEGDDPVVDNGSDKEVERAIVAVGNSKLRDIRLALDRERDDAWVVSLRTPSFVPAN